MCRHQYLIARMQSSKFYHSAQDKCEGIESVATPYGMLRADIGGILLLESLHLLALEIATRPHYLGHSIFDLCAMTLGDSLQIEKFYHYYEINTSNI